MTAKYNKLFKEWIVRAQDDEVAAQTLLKEKVSFGVSCFLSQQVAEKSLKAFLVANNKEFPKIHQIERLIGLCSDINQDFKKFGEDAVILTEFYIESRYPADAPEGFTENDAKQAFEIATNIKNFVINILL